MNSNAREAKILTAVANGATLVKAGASLGISSTRTKDLLNKICRKLKMSSAIKDIKASPNKYLKKLDELNTEESKKEPHLYLRSTLVSKLKSILKLNSASDLTPKYLSNITASQLINRGVSIIAITELQEWLSRYSLSLKKCPPEGEAEIKEVRRAIALLDAFYFDTTTIKSQLSFLLES